MRLVAAERGPLDVRLPPYLEYLRHRRSVPELSETMGHDLLPKLPSVVSSFRLVPEALRLQQAHLTPILPARKLRAAPHFPLKS
jgi:hypothetical protein